MAWRLEVGLTRPRLEGSFPGGKFLVRRENSPPGKNPRRKLKLGHCGASGGMQAGVDLDCVLLMKRRDQTLSETGQGTLVSD